MAKRKRFSFLEKIDSVFGIVGNLAHRFTEYVINERKKRYARSRMENLEFDDHLVEPFIVKKYGTYASDDPLW